jgi:hypothetical protein
VNNELTIGCIYADIETTVKVFKKVLHTSDNWAGFPRARKRELNSIGELSYTTPIFGL